MLFVVILILYSLVIIAYLVAYFFVVYHLIKYSVNISLNKILLPIFIIVSTLLLLSNIMLFFSVDWKSLLSNFPI